MVELHGMAIAEAANSLIILRHAESAPGVQTRLPIHRIVKEACVELLSAFPERQTRLAACLAAPKTRPTGKIRELVSRMAGLGIYLQYMRKVTDESQGQRTKPTMSLPFKSNADASRNFTEAQGGVIHVEQGLQYGSGLPLHPLMREVEVGRPL